MTRHAALVTAVTETALSAHLTKIATRGGYLVHQQSIVVTD
jgi:hypothetical protein